VIGQPHIITTLKNSIKAGRIAHAFLFTGPRGVGKTSLARIFAKAVNCVNGPTAEPCNVCENCVGIASGNFVDVIEIDAASTRGIDDIKELRETVRYLPMKAAYKVYILDEAHMLTDQARNAFLKTLEEPPGHNIFILATTESQKIPYTIMSRCQRFDFRRITEREITQQLKAICTKDGIAFDEGAFHHVAIEADGSMRDAESILEQIIAYGGQHISESDVINIIGVVEKEVVYRIVKSIITKDLREGLSAIEATLSEGYDVGQVYRGLVGYLRNMMIIKAVGGLPEFVSMGEEEYRALSGLIEDIEYYEIQNMLYYMLRSEDLMRGLFPRIALETLYINLYNLVRRVALRPARVRSDTHRRGAPVEKKIVPEIEPVLRHVVDVAVTVEVPGDTVVTSVIAAHPLHVAQPVGDAIPVIVKGKEKPVVAAVVEITLTDNNARVPGCGDVVEAVSREEALPSYLQPLTRLSLNGLSQGPSLAE
jgi:DNA polymerase-3 subunit gamma/tau